MNEFKFWLKHHNYEWKFKLAVCLPLFIVLVAIDWGTKLYMQFNENQWDSGTIIKGFLGWKYQINPGSAYGANSDNIALAIGLAAAITLITAFIIVFLNDKKWLVAVVFIFAGSFANLIARSWAPAVTDAIASNGSVAEVFAGQKGGVIDFLIWDFDALNANSYVFNMADLWVNIGVILLVIMLIIEVVVTLMKIIDNASRKDLGSPEKNLMEDLDKVRAAKIDGVEKTTKTISDEVVYTEEHKDYNSMTKEEKKRFQKEIKAKEKLEKLKEKR